MSTVNFGNIPPIISVVNCQLSTLEISTLLYPFSTTDTCVLTVLPRVPAMGQCFSLEAVWKKDKEEEEEEPLKFSKNQKEGDAEEGNKEDYG